MFILQRNLKKYNVFLLLAINILLLSSCGKPSEISSFKNTFSISSNVDIELTEIYNSYSGSPYEGQSLYTVDIKSDTSTFFEEWNDVPMSDNIVDFFYEKLGNSPSRASEIGLPKIVNGKWKFIDRDNTTFTESSTYNFSVCIFDSEAGIVYYYKIDT